MCAGAGDDAWEHPHLQTQLRAMDQTIARELQADARTIDSVPGLGPVWTAGLPAEIGSIHRFTDDGALAKYAGLVWPAHESGDFQAETADWPRRATRICVTTWSKRQQRPAALP